MKMCKCVILLVAAISFAGCPVIEETDDNGRLVVEGELPVAIDIDSDSDTEKVVVKIVTDTSCEQALTEALNDIQCDYGEYVAELFKNEILRNQLAGLLEKHDVTRNKLWVICDEYCFQTKVCECKEFFGDTSYMDPIDTDTEDTETMTE